MRSNGVGTVGVEHRSFGQFARLLFRVRSKHFEDSLQAYNRQPLNIREPRARAADVTFENRSLLRVCMVAACPFPANHGTPGSIREMAEALADEGHEVHVVTYNYGEPMPVRSVHVHRIAPWIRETKVTVGPTLRRPLYDLQLAFATFSLVRRVKPHVIHAHGYEATLAAALCRPFVRAPLIYSAHNTMADELASYDFIRPRWLADATAGVLDAGVPRLASHCLPHSANTARFLERQGLGARTQDVVNFGIDTAWMSGGTATGVREWLGLSRDPLILYTGVLDRFQRLDLLLQATALVLRRQPAATLLIVTTIPQANFAAALRAHARRLGISERVVITEPQALDRVRDILQVADVAVVPRPAAAGFPIKLLNYMAAGRAAVLFRSSASTGIVHRENAMLASPDTAEALADQILELLNDDTLRRDIARRGSAFVRAHHDRIAIARMVARCYERALGQPQARTAEWHAYSS